MTRTLTLIGAVVVPATLWLPQESGEAKRTIRVTARSEIQVDPDEVELVVTVETLDAEILRSKALNDTITRNVMQLAKKHELPDETIKTTRFDLGPKLERTSRRLLGYELTRTIEVRFRDFAKVETILQDVLDAGVTRIESLRFVVSNQRKHQFRARELAVTYAREKADHLSRLNGLAVGKPIRIEEDVEFSPDAGGFGGGFFGAGLDENQRPRQKPVVQHVAFRPQDDQERLIAPGQVTLQANVTIEFELVPRP